MAQRALPLLLMLFAPVVTSHGHLLRAVIKPKDGGADKVAEIEAALQAQITEQRTPTQGSGLPW